MYVNPHFSAEDPAALHAFIDDHPFGLLVSCREGLKAAHIPFVLHRTEGPRGTLIAHTAARDPLAQDIAAGAELLAVFTGPVAYVTPRWYEDPGLPTYNFLAIHAYGHARPMTVRDDVLTHLRELVDIHEASFDPPWSLDRASEDYVEPLLKEIAPFTLEIERLDGKLKISQNRSAADREGVIAGLRELAGEEGLHLAGLMDTHPYTSDVPQPLLEAPAAGATSDASDSRDPRACRPTLTE